MGIEANLEDEEEERRVRLENIQREEELQRKDVELRNLQHQVEVLQRKEKKNQALMESLQSRPPLDNLFLPETVEPVEQEEDGHGSFPKTSENLETTKICRSEEKNFCGFILFLFILIGSVV